MNIETKNNFDQLLEKLQILSIKNQLFGQVEKIEVTFTDKDASKLLGYASILSVSEDASDISLSYEIVTRLLENYRNTNSYVIKSAEILLARIGNFPGLELLKNRYSSEQKTTV